MTELIRTTSDNPHFRELENMLNSEMTSRYGELQKWYNQFNIIESNKTVVVAYTGTIPAGCGCIRKYNDVSAEIKRMFVKPENRGTGIAGKILHEIEKWASELGFSYTVLETAIKQPEAIRFYIKSGYFRIENYGQYAGNQNSICMKKILMKKPIQFDLVADLYDSYVKTDFDLNFFLQETSDCQDEILELMCGTGRLSVPLLKAGRKLCCVDYSEKMLDAFRSKVNGKNYPVRVFRMDVTWLSLNKKFNLIILPFHSLSEILSAELQSVALRAISDHLSPGGIFICTLQNPADRLKTTDGTARKLGDFIIEGNRRLVLSYSNKYDPGTGIVSGYQQYDIYDQSGNLSDQRILDINFRPVTDSEFKALIKDLDLEIISQYGDYENNPFDEQSSRFMIYKLRKQNKKG